MSYESVLHILRLYVKWCEHNGYPTSNGVFDIDADNVDRFKGLMVASPLHLQLSLDKAFNSPEAETIDCVYRAFFWMAYAGLEDYEALQVRAGDVDLVHMRVMFNDIPYELYREGIPCFERVCGLTEFVHKHPLYGSLRMNRVPGDLIMRGIKADADLRTLRTTLNVKFKRYDVALTYKRIYLSGIFYRMYERERAGIPVDFNPIVATELSKREYKSYNLVKISHHYRKGFLRDYKKWKEAFL